ncbi:SHOCT domain-containing protein [Pseudoprevotella muciniphila]|uniref:SHOCT domain-containing protein n=1 Tax=Pseudoprevotella muciniphila TaxID=2133944 RepID=UPI0018689B0A|nr:SHOCT domain-containing protein [Pseudoprevotella muciniphila]
MKPVEVEFLMKDGLSKGVDKSREGIEQLLDASRRVREILSRSGEEGARASDKYSSKLSGLRQAVEKMSASLKSMGVSEKDTAGVLMKSSEQNVNFIEAQATRLRSMEEMLRSALESGNTALAESTRKEMETVETWINEALDSIQNNAKLIPTIVENASTEVPDQQVESMRAQLRKLTNEIAATTLEYRRMTDAERNSAAGMELKRKLEELVRKAGDLRDAMDDVNRQVRGSASDTKTFDAISQGLNVVASSAGAATSVFQMFGAKQEDLINIQTKLQATLAISNALTVIQNNLQKESSLMLGIRTIQEKAHAAAIALRTAAEGRGVIVTKLATIAQAAFNAVANANPYVLLATAILTVVGALVAFTTGSNEATAAEKRQREEGERLRKQQEDMSNALGQATGNVEAKYRSLQQQWSRLKTESEKNKWIKENANKFHELGLNVNSVSDAEQVLVNMAPQVIEALRAVAEAEAYSDLYKQAIIKRAQKWEYRVKSRATGDYYTTAKPGDKVSDEEHKAAGLTEEDYNHRTINSPMHPGLIRSGLNQSGADKVNADRNREAIKTNKELKKGLDEEVNYYRDKSETSQQKATVALSRIPSRFRYNGGGGGGSSSGSGRNGSGGNGGGNGSGGNGSGNDLKDEKDRAEALKELQAKNRQEEIDQMAEGAKKKRAQLRLDYAEEKAELDALEKDWSAAQKGKLTKAQTDALEEARKLAQSKLDNGEAEIDKEEAELERVRRRAETQAMVEYLKEYGSYQQQKLAIAEEYAQKIADVEASEADEATKQWQKKKLNKERLQREASLSFENISRGIDWHALFSGVGDLTKEMMAPMMEQLQAWVKTDEYKNADAETQQKVTDLIQEMRKYVGTDQSVTWQALDKAIKDFTAAVAAYDKAKREEDAAVRARDEGKKRLDAGEITADEYKALEQRAQELGDATAQAREDMEAFGGALNRTSEEVANFTSGLTTALSNAKGWTGADGFGNIQSAVGGIDQLKGTLDSILPQMGDGMAKTIGTKLSSTIGSTLGSIGSGIEGLLSSGLGSVIGIVAQIPRLILDLVGAIKNFVTGILDALTELISLRWIDDLVVSILDAVGNLIDAIFDLPENLFKVLESIVVNGVGGLLDGVIGRIGNILTFGALSSSVSDWFTNSNAAEVAETIDRLTKRNELLEQAIEDLTDEMKSARGARAIDASTRARQLQEETNANYKSIAQAQAGYHSAHHSWNYYWDGFSQEQIARLSGQIGRQWNGDLWDLSPEEMKMLRSNVDMWKLIADTGKGPYGESVQEKLNAYIDQAGKLQEITDALYENLTTTTKENVFDDFLGSLYDLADGSEEVMDNIADNWQKMVNRMAVNNLVGAKFQKNLEEWYENLAKLNEARTNGEITDEEYRKRLDALKAEYDGYVESAKRDIETLRTEGIVKATEENSGVTQSGKAGAFTTMSQDQAGKLEGLFVSGQMHWASMDDKLTDVTRQMDEAGDHLRQIATNTGSSAQSLGEIKEDIKKMIRDGLKMK